MSATPTTNEEIKAGIDSMCEAFFNDFADQHGIVLAQVTEAYMQQVMLIEGLSAVLVRSSALSEDIETVHNVVDQFCRYILSVYFNSIAGDKPDAITDESSKMCFEAARNLVHDIREWIKSTTAEA